MKKILLVDDEELNRYLIKRYIFEYGFIIFEAENGEDALKISKEEEIDLVLMDIMMPVMNGIDATIEIKKTKPDLPVIAISAYIDDNSNRLNCFDEKLTKPVSIRTINNLIKRYLL